MTATSISASPPSRDKSATPDGKRTSCGSRMTKRPSRTRTPSFPPSTIFCSFADCPEGLHAFGRVALPLAQRLELRREVSRFPFTCVTVDSTWPLRALSASRSFSQAGARPGCSRGLSTCSTRRRPLPRWPGKPKAPASSGPSRQIVLMVHGTILSLALDAISHALCCAPPGGRERVRQPLASAHRPVNRLELRHAGRRREPPPMKVGEPLPGGARGPDATNGVNPTAETCEVAGGQP